MPEPRTVVVIAPNWLGDAVMALPAISDLRRAVSPATLVVAARRSVADLFRLVPSVDSVLTLRWDGRWWRRRAFEPDVRALREVGADAALVLPNSFASAWLVRQAGIAERWGYRSDLRGTVLSRAVRRPKRRVHQGAYYQHLTRALGFPSGPLQPEIAISDSALATARRQLLDRGWNGERAVIALAPGAAYGTAKRWIPAHAAQLVTDLVRQKGATCVLVGTRADAPTTKQIQDALDDHTRREVIDLTGETTLEGLAAILGLARTCVSNDSGAMHLAAAIGTPVVALFGPTREDETAPLTRAGGRAEVLTHPVWCRPCMLRECPIDHRCMKGIDPSRVFATVDRLLA
jgi:heptosyltransferase-2